MKKWFRIHLSTALILSVVAWPLFAGFLYLSRSAWETTPLITPAGVGVFAWTWGWPSHCYTSYDPPILPAKWNYGALAIDMAIPLAVLWLISRLCEYRIARYESKRERVNASAPPV